MYKSSSFLSEVFKYDRFGEEKYHKTSFKSYKDGKLKISEVKTKRNRKGQKTKYEKIENGQLEKKTLHYYKNGLEIKRIEYFFNPTYTATTTFTYEYY